MRAGNPTRTSWSTRHARGLVLGVLGLVLAASAYAQQAGEVEFSRGVGFAQTPGQTARTLGKGLPLREGDRITTSEGASAIVKMADGTRMTVRPNSELVLTQYQFKENAPDNGMLMQLVRGGFRAVTGLISKGSPNAARVQTNTATIGIRGTDFDARLCQGRECAQESAKIPDTARPNAVMASAKIVQVQGDVFATDPQGQRHRLADGGGVFPGELVETGANTHVVLVFRDDSRVTLGSNTRFRLDNFVYDDKNAGEGRFLASVLRGSVRALTGLIAKANNRNVGFATQTATIGIRGTGVDINCTGACAGEPPTGSDSGLTLWTWLGSIAVTPSGTTALQVLQAGQGLLITPTQILAITNPPTNIQGPRPDSNTINIPPNLFSHDNVTDADEGLFVYVRDGQIQVTTVSQVINASGGEAVWAGLGGQTGRPATIPKFMDFDRIPMPNSHNPLLVSVLGEAGIRHSRQCR
ncbi:MAG TPA: FecR domain-containing protein [Ramlibacter sp.]|uniref:FecR family protein n=1 Tax=Ramlibacter sp. TaxID=1917967 RepID=UPI002CC48C27|nr:FecR domain-containing protein [Ramlibacter sp.]HVZ42432.1 FecR domain-containing protein [Ramlibacter sp.]